MPRNLHSCNIIAGILLILSVTFFSCKKEFESPIKTDLKTYSGNLKFEFDPSSVQKIFSSQEPWELKALNYFNIVQQDNTSSMWYISFGYNQLDFNGSFCIANSSDGENWSRPLINNSTNILIPGNNSTGVSGAVVFRDNHDAQYPYKMIGSKLAGNNQKTFLYGSTNGVNWVLIKELFDQMQDSQFSVINMNDGHYVFARYNDYSHKYQRAISLAKLDNNMNVVQQPLLLLEAPQNGTYSHIYNSAASKINDSSVIMLPTYYDDNNGSIQIKLLYTNNMKDYYLVDNNITNYLFPNSKVNWAIVAPGIIPADENNTYWVYYLGTSSKHNDFSNTIKLDVTYYRIKLVIHQP
jgi:hypothetical protein